MCMCVYRKDTVAKECEDDEEYGEDHAFFHPSLRRNPIIHHHVPVLTC